MVLKKDKQNKIAVRPSEKRGDITSRGPLDLWSEMDLMFDNFRSNFDELFWPWGQRPQTLATSYQQRTPPMDIADHGDHYEMRLEIPGIPKEKINIEVTSNTIEISAQHEISNEDQDKNWVRRERSATSFYRALEFPDELSTEKVNAELQDGILTLTLPKVEPKPEHKTKKVKIK